MSVQKIRPRVRAARSYPPVLAEMARRECLSPQKGASKKEIEALERALTRLADVAAKEFGFDYRDEAGASAAGELFLV